jgi:hypothetical protein
MPLLCNKETPATCSWRLPHSCMVFTDGSRNSVVRLFFYSSRFQSHRVRFFLILSCSISWWRLILASQLSGIGDRDLFICWKVLVPSLWSENKMELPGLACFVPQTVVVCLDCKHHNVLFGLIITSCYRGSSSVLLSLIIPNPVALTGNDRSYWN